MNRSLAMLTVSLLFASTVAAATGYNALGSIASASFQDGGTTSVPRAGVVPAATGSDPDIQFYQTALADGERELALSRLAVSQSGSADVGSLASTIVSDQSGMDQELEAAGHLSEPSPTAADNGAVSNMRKMSGALFDRTYLAAIVQDHQRTIATYQNASINAQNSTARNLATAHLSKLQEHLVAVQLLQKDMAGK